MNIRCKICRNNKFNRIRLRDKLYYHCEICDFIFLDRKFHVSIDSEKERYQKHQNSAENKGYVQMFEDFISFLPLKKGQKILDFGCGPNDVLAQVLRLKGFDVDVYDKYFFPDKSFEKKKYDAILMIEVIEHIADPIVTLSKLKSQLNPYGFIGMMTGFQPGDIEQFKKWWYVSDVTHISFFSEKTLKFIADKLDLRLEIPRRNTLLLIRKV